MKHFESLYTNMKRSILYGGHQRTRAITEEGSCRNDSCVVCDQTQYSQYLKRDC